VHRHHRRQPGSRPPLVAGLLVALVLASACGPSTSSAPPSQAAVATPTPTPTPSPSPTATPTATPVPSPTATPTPSTLPGDLTGLPVAPEAAHRLPLAVMIDDSRQARPQSGFNAASVVYQATADGYESRYLLIFQEFDTGDIGPVRSARFFLVQWAQETRSALAHYGGDQRTRTYLRWHKKQYTDVDGLGRGRPAYHRIKTRRAPHNAYTSTKDLRRQADKLGAPEELPADLYRRPFVDASPVAERAASQRIRVPYHTNVITYRYDRESNRYRRSIDGKAHVDPADGKRVAPTNVVVLYQRFRIDTKIEPGHSRPDIKTLGSGKALVFQEGRVIKGTWSKKNDTAPTRITAGGKDIPLVRGQTFIQVVPTSAKVTWSD